MAPGAARAARRAVAPASPEVLMRGRAVDVLLPRDGEIGVVQDGDVRTSMRRIKGLAAIPAAIALSILVSSVAAAGVGDHDTPIKSCFGIASGQRASVVGDTGEHASSFDEPRLGIGQLIFKVFGFTSIGEAGSFLATVDGIDATSCD